MKEKKMQKISVTRALAELKRLDDRINRANQSSVFVGVSVGTGTNIKVHNSHASVNDVNSSIQGAYDQINVLFIQRQNIKAAIVKSNAVTMVKVGNREVSVAEAIEMKSSIQLKKNLLNVLRQQAASANAAVAQLNAQLEATIDSNLKTIYGADKSKVDASVYDSVAIPQKAQKQPSFIDPMNIAKRITDIEEEVSIVETELDFTLSEINAKTEIDVA
jgi:hypothetical protein